MSEANKAIVYRLFAECLNRHNPDLYPALYSDVVYRAPAMGELRNEEHRQFLLSVLEGFPDAQWAIEDQVAEGDRVVTRWTFTGTHTKTFMGIDGTGRKLRITGLSMDRIANGKIVEEWEEWDTLGTVQQLALLPPETRAWPPRTADPVAEPWASSTRI